MTTPTASDRALRLHQDDCVHRREGEPAIDKANCRECLEAEITAAEAAAREQVADRLTIECSQRIKMTEDRVRMEERAPMGCGHPRACFEPSALDPPMLECSACASIVPIVVNAREEERYRLLAPMVCGHPQACSVEDDAGGCVACQLACAREQRAVEEARRECADRIRNWAVEEPPSVMEWTRLADAIERGERCSDDTKA